MVILALPAPLPQNPGFSPPRKQKKPTKRKLCNLQQSSQEKKMQPRKENKKEMHYNNHQYYQEKEKKPIRTKVVNIRASDPDATESSSDEDEAVEVTKIKKKVRGQLLHAIRIPLYNDLASSSMVNHKNHEKDEYSGWKISTLHEFSSKTSPSPTEKDTNLQVFQENERKSKKVELIEKQEKKNIINGGSSSDFGVKKELVLDYCQSFGGLCDVPGPIPDDLDSLMNDEESLVLNFFEGLPEIY